MCEPLSIWCKLLGLSWLYLSENDSLVKIVVKMNIFLESSIFWYLWIFEKLYILISCQIFVFLALCLFSKRNNCHWECWFVVKNLTNYDSPLKKFHNRTDTTKHANFLEIFCYCYQRSVDSTYAHCAQHSSLINYLN